MAGEVPTRLTTEMGKGLEARRHWSAQIGHTIATSLSPVVPVGISEIDVEIRKVIVTPGNKPTANSGNLVDLWLGAPGTTDDVQTITMTATGGTFRVGFGGLFTAAQAYNVSTGNLQTALRGLANIGGTNVAVSGSAGTSYVITAGSGLGHMLLPMFQLDTSGLTGGTATIAHTTPGVGVRVMRRLLDADLAAATPVSYTPGAFPFTSRVPANVPLVATATFAGDDSANPTSIDVRVYIEIPWWDAGAVVTSQGAYNHL